MHAIIQEDQDAQKALSTIASLTLTPPEHRLLSCFVQDAVDPKAAALYVLQRASRNGNDLIRMETELYNLLGDWKRLVERFTSPTQVSASTRSLVAARDGGFCCITRRSKVWWDVFGWSRPIPVRIAPTDVIAGLETPLGESLRQILAVFITDYGLRQLHNWLNVPSDDLSQLRNTWTLAGTAAVAFRTGRIQILLDWISGKSANGLENSSCKYMLSYGLVRPFVGIENDKGKIVRSLEVVSISTKDPEDLPLPSAFLFSIHARFCNSLRWLQVQDQMQRGWPGNAFYHSCKTTFRKAISYTIPTFRRLWLYFPRWYRALTYRLLLKVGNKTYGRTLNWVQRVPFGLYIKHGPGRFVPSGEGPALRLVEQYTNVAAPRLIDLLITESETYLVMTRVPGIPLEEAIQSFSYTERSQLAADIRSCVTQFRQIPNPNSAAICGADGGPAFDYRLGDPAGPFDSEEDFNKHVTFRSSLRSAIHDHRHNIFFSHADFSPTNILVELGKLSGIVDFGCAGFYPEYWEYTKGIYGHFGLETAWPDTLSDAFSGLYKDELAAEKLLWENGNTF